MKTLFAICLLATSFSFSEKKLSLKEEAESFRKSIALTGLTCIVVSPKHKHGLIDTAGKVTFLSDVSMTDETHYHIGRVTQPLVASFCSMLESDNRIDLKDTLDKLLPKDRKKLLEMGKELTIHDLLSHQSGIPTNITARPSIATITAGIAFSTLERLRLSEKKRVVDDLNYTLIGSILERKLDRRVQDLFLESIQNELGLTQTKFSLSGSEKAKAALFDSKESTTAREWATSIFSRGLFSTPKEIAKLMSAYAGLKKTSLTLPSIEGNEVFQHAQSWDIEKVAGQSAYIISDYYAGTQIYMAIAPETRSAVCVICTRKAEIDTFAKKLLADLCEGKL